MDEIPRDLTELDLDWLSVVSVLHDVAEEVGNPWPEEFRGLETPTLLRAILETEERLRPDLDATARLLARGQRLAVLSPLERWHLMHRLSFAVRCCDLLRRSQTAMPEDSQDAMEHLLVAYWLANVPGWREIMRTQAASLAGEDTR